MLHLLYTYAVTPGQPEATAKAREGLRDALSCYNKALGDEKARYCMRDVDLISWLSVCPTCEPVPTDMLQTANRDHNVRCASQRYTQFANLSIA